MGDLDVPLLVLGGAVLVFGPLCLALLAADGSSCGYVRSTRQFARAALWSGFVIYAGLAAAALLAEWNGPPPRIGFFGLTRLPFWAEVALGTNGLAVLWAWWTLRDEERHPDRAKVDAAQAEEREAEEWRRKDRAAAPSNPTADGR